jgi:hypothetical protein
VDPHRQLAAVSTRLNALQSEIEAQIADQLGFHRDGQRLMLDQEMDAQDATCEAVERWAEAKSENPGLMPVTPLQRLLDDYVAGHEAHTEAMKAAGFRS